MGQFLINEEDDTYVGCNMKKVCRQTFVKTPNTFIPVDKDIVPASRTGYTNTSYNKTQII